MENLSEADRNRIFGFVSQRLDDPKDLASCANVCEGWRALLDGSSELSKGEKGIAFQVQKLAVYRSLQERWNIAPEMAGAIMAVKPKEWTDAEVAAELETRRKPLPHPQAILSPLQKKALQEQAPYDRRIADHILMTVMVALGALLVERQHLPSAALSLGVLGLVVGKVLRTDLTFAQSISHSVWLPDRQDGVRWRITLGCWNDMWPLAVAVVTFIASTRWNALLSRIPLGQGLFAVCNGVLTLKLCRDFWRETSTAIADRGEAGRLVPAEWFRGQPVWSRASFVEGCRLDLDARACLAAGCIDTAYAEKLFWLQDFAQRMDWDEQSEVQWQAIEFIVGDLQMWHRNANDPLDQMHFDNAQHERTSYPVELRKTVEWLRDEGRHQIGDVYANPFAL